MDDVILFENLDCGENVDSKGGEGEHAIGGHISIQNAPLMLIKVTYTEFETYGEMAVDLAKLEAFDDVCSRVVEA